MKKNAIVRKTISSNREDKKNSIMKTGFITSVLDKTANNYYYRSTGGYRKEVQSGERDYRNINIVFVIDGSDKVQKYMQSVISSIENSMGEVQKWIHEISLISTVVCWNYSCDADQVVSIQDLSPNVSTITGFCKKSKRMRHGLF